MQETFEELENWTTNDDKAAMRCLYHTLNDDVDGVVMNKKKQAVWYTNIA